MAGSGGSGYGGGIIGGGSGSDLSCATLIFEAPVASPDPAVVSQLSLGDTCDVVIGGSPAQVRLLLRPTGAILGALTDHLADLTKCISDRYEYIAEVIAITPVVRVRVQPRSGS